MPVAQCAINVDGLSNTAVVMSGEAFRRVLDKLDGVKENGTHADALCPLHDDRKQSLSVAINADNDGVVMFCHALCATKDVLREIGLTMADLYDVPRESNGDSHTWYEYADADGVVRYVKRRTWPKQFVLMHPDRETYKKPPGAPSLLYRLPNVIEAVRNGDEVWIAEGEKDADALVRHGVCATTNDGGAGKWRHVEPCANEHLKGARVVIVPDRDDAGYEHARDVARRSMNVAASITVKEPKVGKDAFDHLAAGLTIDDFVTLATNDTLAAWLDEPEPSTNEAQPPARLSPPLDWRELLEGDSRIDWLVDGVWPRGRQVHIHAPRKVGKSLFMLWIACCLACGREPLSGKQRTPELVCYFDWEMSEDDIRQRVQDMGFKWEELHNLKYHLFPPIAPLDTKEGGQQLLHEVQQDVCEAQHDGTPIVMLDSMARAVQGDENSNDTYRAFFRHTGMLLKQHAISLGRLDNEGHVPGRSRGASAKADDVDVVWQMKATVDGFQLIREASRIGWIPETINVKKVSNDDDPLSFQRTDLASYPAAMLAKARELDQCGAPEIISQRDAIELLKANGFKPGRTQTLMHAINYRFERGILGFLS